MANVFSGNLLSPVAIHSSVNPGLRTYLPVAGSSYTHLVDSFESDNMVDNYPPSYTGVNSNAVIAPSFKDDFYFKIRYFPNNLNLGAITGGQVKDLYVWNGFLDDRTLTSITLNNGDGIQIGGGSPPTLFNPIELKQYTITIEEQGSPTIDASIDFDWLAPTLDGSVTIVGTRIVAFPYLFKPGVSESLTWSTNVITKRKGSEQRVRLRNAPRQSFGISAFVPFSELARVDNLMYGWRGNIWGVPIYSESRNITASTSTGSPDIQVNTEFSEFRVNELAIIWEGHDNFELVQIESITTSTLTTTQNISKVFSTNAIVAPVVPCRMTSSPTRSTTGYNATLEVNFESIENKVLTQVSSPATYLTYDVFTDRPLKSGDTLTDQYETRVDVLDYTAPNVKTFNVWDSTKIARSFLFEFATLSELWTFRLWLHRRSGKLLPFWMPTFESNFKIITTGLIENNFTVVNEGQAVQGANRNHIGILTTSDTWIFAEIQTIAEVSGDVDVTLTSPLNIQSDTIQLICYIGLKRLGSDTIEITHLANNVSNVELSILEIDQ